MDTSKLPNRKEEFSIASDELPAKFKELAPGAPCGASACRRRMGARCSRSR
jgi:hypothetical protein